MDNRGVVERFVEAFTAADWESMSELLDPDYVEVYPQSGERIRGWKVMVSNNPGPPHGHSIETIGGDPVKTKVISSPLPIGMPIIEISNAGNSFTNESLMEYPNGDRYHVIVIGEVKAGKVIKPTVYAAPPMEPAEWRAPYVESIEDG